MGDRYEKLWEEYWRQTHAPDANGEYYFDRHRREDAEGAPTSPVQEGGSDA